MLALVTGASSGIGLQYATQLARDYHTDLLLVSNQEKELKVLAERNCLPLHGNNIPLLRLKSLKVVHGNGIILAR